MTGVERCKIPLTRWGSSKARHYVSLDCGYYSAHGNMLSRSNHHVSTSQATYLHLSYSQNSKNVNVWVWVNRILHDSSQFIHTQPNPRTTLRCPAHANVALPVCAQYCLLSEWSIYFDSEGTSCARHLSDSSRWIYLMILNWLPD